MPQRYLAGRGVNRLIQRQLQREPKNIPLAVVNILVINQLKDALERPNLS
jgi:hypothetical protein